MWGKLKFVVLAAALAGLGWSIAARGTGVQLGGAPAALETPYTSERAWAVREIVADIEEMASTAGRANPPDASTLTPWDPAAFAALARARFTPATAADGNAAVADVLPLLTRASVPALVQASDLASGALKADRRDARAHEAAALTLAAFGLGEAADDFTDLRWVLNRMTAHLAVAGALRGDAEPSREGQLAIIALDVFSNRQSRALQGLTAFDLKAAGPESSWARALTMRVTQDWRLLPSPAAATRLEKREYFRARRAAVPGRRAADDLAAIDEPAASDLNAIVQNHTWGVADGHQFIAESIDMLLDEARETQRVLSVRAGTDLMAALNERASRLMTAEGPRVLPWGAWAELYQRRIAEHVEEIDQFHRHMIGSRESADRERARLDAQLGSLALYSLGATGRTAGPNGKEADLSRIGDAIALAAAAPEQITQPTWLYLETGSRYEAVAKAMPRAAGWFAQPTPAIPFQAGVRLKDSGHRVASADLDALLEQAPHDLWLVSAALAPRRAGDPRPSRAMPALQARFDYDLVATDMAVSHAATDAERAEAYRRSCAMSARDCVDLAATLARMGDEAGAAAHYEKAFADPGIDAVAFSNQNGWLINYYYRQKRTRDALRLAEKGADTGSWRGMIGAAYLYERLERLDEADELYRRVASRYKDPSQMFGFYYRQSFVRKRAAFDARWATAVAESFPRGLQPAPTALPPQPPSSGVFVYKDAELSRKAGIRAGDIIVGLEGHRVDTYEQYAALNACFETDAMKLTVWRGKVFEVEVTAPGRLMGIELRTHPVKGWIE